jgi:hypothetical protein
VPFVKTSIFKITYELPGGLTTEGAKLNVKDADYHRCRSKAVKNVISLCKTLA